MLSISHRDNEVQYPGVVIENIPLRSFADGEGNCATVDIQPLLEVRYFVSEPEGSQCALLLPSLNSGSEALGNVEDSGGVVLVELHHRFGRAGGDGSHRSHGGPYGGRRANGHLDQSVNGDGRHSSGSVGVVIGARIVFAEPSVDKGMVG
jgi:hypothetical protein